MQTYKEAIQPPATVHSLYHGRHLLYYTDHDHVYRRCSNQGPKVPGVTSISGIAKDAEPLMIWAAEVGAKYYSEKIQREGAVHEDVVRGAKFAWRGERDAAGLQGTFLHAKIEEYVKARIDGRPEPDAWKVGELYLPSYARFVDWCEGQKVEFLACERLVYSVEHDFAGTLDILVKINGVIFILDVKTSKKAQPNHYLQSAGYSIAVAEEDGIPQPDFKILVLPRAEPGRMIISRGRKSLEEHTNCFLALRKVWDWQNAGTKGYSK